MQILWLRRLIRRYTSPVPRPKATTWKTRLSVIYFLVAWNAFGIVCYQVYKGKSDWAHFHGYKTDEEVQEPPGFQWAKTLNIKDAEVYRISGLNVRSYNIRDGKIVRPDDDATDEKQPA